MSKKLGTKAAPNAPRRGTDANHDAQAARAESGVQDRAVQHELRREEAEGGDLVGDTHVDRHVDGSSSFVTLPPDAPQTPGG